MIDGVAVMRADGSTAPFLRPFDLENTTLTFTPSGGESYTITRGPLAYEPDRGVSVALTGSPRRAAYRLPFDFSVFGRSIRDVYLSSFNGIHGAPPTSSSVEQYDAMEAIGQRAPLLAPLLMTPELQVAQPGVFVRTSTEAVTVTWATPDNYDAGNYDVRATLFRDGRIQFSYVHVPSTLRVQDSAAVIVTSGSEAWRQTETALGQAADPINDLDPAAVSQELAPILDIVDVRASRVGAFDLLRVSLSVAAAPDPTLIAAGGSIRYHFIARSATNSAVIGVRLFANGEIRLIFNRPASGFTAEETTTTARFDGAKLAVDVPDSILGFTPDTMDAQSYLVTSGFARKVDEATVTLGPVQPTSAIMTDLSAIPAGGTSASVILEVFSRPAVNVFGVWSLLRGATGWRDEDIDAVAIYENFRTDLDFWASAYATGGNPGVDGIGNTQSAADPRGPTLLQMNVAEFSPSMLLHNRELLHEFGHRWLFFVGYRDATGAIRHDLNPAAYLHPAAWVDTRAAFRVAEASDSSVMGGGYFTPRGDGSFALAPVSPQGYSWLDLYLMGLAAPEEVPPFFWIENSTPALRNEYWPPFNLTFVQGDKREVRVQDVIAAEGPRIPSYPATQRSFRVAFVLLADPSKPVSLNDVAGVTWARDTLIRDFSSATGGRATVVALTAPAGTPRRRSARH